jgi:hypothetical protein
VDDGFKLGLTLGDELGVDDGFAFGDTPGEDGRSVEGAALVVVAVVRPRPLRSSLRNGWLHRHYRYQQLHCVFQ